MKCLQRRFPITADFGAVSLLLKEALQRLLNNTIILDDQDPFDNKRR